ncbi:MAG: hypothetical protein GXO21_04245 [Aquificae bacterium]|nr:hypothetical protein [Aquificota bacterium]
MWVKLLFEMKSPAIIKPYVPLDGAFSYAYAKLTGFKYRYEEGYIYGNLLKRKYGYIDELPIKKTRYGNGKWFYNISGMIFQKVKDIDSVLKEETAISRKLILEKELFSRRGLSFDSNAFGSGKERSFLTKVETIYYPLFAVVLETDNPNEIETLAIEITGIGKKVNQGYGMVKYLAMEEIEVKDFKVKDFLIRPVPKGLVADDNYLEYEMRLFSPYYIPNRKYSDICYVDRKLFNSIPVNLEGEKTQTEPEVVF